MFKGWKGHDTQNSEQPVNFSHDITQVVGMCQPAEVGPITE